MKIKDIENKILETLNQEPLSTYCNNFGTFDGNMEAEVIRKLQDNLPACLVSYISDTFKESTFAVRYMVTREMSVMVIATKIRGTETKKGIYSMLEDVTDRLHKSDLGGFLDTPIILKDRRLIEAAHNVAVYWLTFELEFID